MDLRAFPVLFLAPALLLGQSRPSERPVTDEVRFLFFFLRVSASESAAKAKGKSDSPSKQALKNKVGLTDTEISLVNEVALSCNAATTRKR